LNLQKIKQNTTLSDKAYQMIRNAIIFNSIKSGDVLLEEKLSEELSISRTPIRTALHRLVDEGLAETQGKSIVVSALTESDLKNISYIRLNLELMVIEKLQDKVTDSLIENLTETLERQKSLSMDSPENFAEYVRQDYIFHTTLAQATDNSFLLDLVARINTHSNRCLLLSTSLAYSSVLAMEEHRQIIEALGRRDFILAHAVMQYHLAHVEERFLNHRT